MPYDETLQVRVKLDSREAEQKIDQLKAKAQVEIGTDKITQSLKTIDDEFDKIFNYKKSNSLAAKLKNSFNAIEKPLKEVQSRLKSDFLDIKINPEMQLDNGGYSREDLMNMTLMNSQGQQVNLDATSIDAYLNLRKQVDDAYASIDKFINKQQELEKQMQEIAHAAEIHDWFEDEDGYFAEVGIEEEEAANMITELSSKYVELEKSINKANEAVRKLAKEQQELLDSSPVKTDKQSPKESMLDINSGISRLAKAFSLGTLLFKLILKVVNLLEQSIKNGLENVYNWSEENGYRYKDSNDAFASAGNYIDNAMGALAEFVWNDLEPVLTAFLVGFADIVSQLTETIATIKSWITGEAQTYLEASLVNIEAADAQSKNNKDLKKLISGFDELNIWSKSNSSDSSKYDNAFTEKTVDANITGVGKTVKQVAVKLNAALSPFFQLLNEDFWEGASKSITGFIQFVQGIATFNLVDIVEGTKTYWEGMWQATVKPILDAIIEPIASVDSDSFLFAVGEYFKVVFEDYIPLAFWTFIKSIVDSVNNVITAIEIIINWFVGQINDFITTINRWFGWNIGTLSNVPLGKIDTSGITANIQEHQNNINKFDASAITGPDGTTLRDVVDAIKDTQNQRSSYVSPRIANLKNLQQKVERAY